MDDSLPSRPRKGRGAVGNPAPRFDRETRSAVDDGWRRPDDPEDEPPPLRTTVMVDATRSIIARNKSPDIRLRQSINPYRGCEHGCIYCFARPTHAYLGLSPGLDFESRIFVKADAPALLRAELVKPSYRCKADRARRQHRSLSAGRAQARHHPPHPRSAARVQSPGQLITKSALVQRDIDILGADGGASTSPASRSRSRPSTATSRARWSRAPRRRERRLDTIARAGRGRHSGGGDGGADDPGAQRPRARRHPRGGGRAAARVGAGYVLLRLPLELAQLFEEWLEAHVAGQGAACDVADPPGRERQGLSSPNSARA